VRRAAAQMRSAQCAGAGAQLTGTQQSVNLAASSVKVTLLLRGLKDGQLLDHISIAAIAALVFSWAIV